MSAVSAASSSGVVGDLRCVERCCPRTRQARRSGTPSSATTCSTQARRRAGLRSFPGQPRPGSSCRASDRTPPGAAGRSQPRAPSAASPGRPSGRRTPTAIGSTSPPYTPIARTASATGRPCAVSTSTCRSLATISSAVCRFLGIPRSSIWPKAILQGGPLPRGQATPTRGSRRPRQPVTPGAHRVRGMVPARLP